MLCAERSMYDWVNNQLLDDTYSRNYNLLPAFGIELVTGNIVLVHRGPYVRRTPRVWRTRKE
ncbi:hypothetical protein L218DRAFT_957544 [Marasmius fiardii PR-910]|nr:hypothetical protein L218DRAFT_957544 [Marasmius fiardii PR-910]